MERQQILDGYAKLRKNIEQEKEKSFEKIVKYINRNFSEQPKEEFINQVFNLILDSLEKTYSLTAAAVKEIYNIQDSGIENIEVDKLTYSQDGKTLKDRLNIHYSEAKEKQNKFALKIEKINLDGLSADDPVPGLNAAILYLDNRTGLILDTESSYLSNYLLHQKLKERATHAEVYGVGECHLKDGSPCEEWIRMGKMPIEELVEIPPYHPSCECEVIYYIEEKLI